MVIAIDWDHTLMNGEEWLPGAQNALKLLNELGHEIIIHSCNDEQWIQGHLNDAGIPVNAIHTGDGCGKPIADIYIDDRGFRFPRNGSWVEELPKILGVLANEEDL